MLERKRLRRIATVAAFLFAAIAGFFVLWLGVEPLVVPTAEQIEARCREPVSNKQRAPDNQQHYPDEVSFTQVLKAYDQHGAGQSSDQQVKYECVVAQYTLYLARYTFWLVAVTFFLIVIGAYQGSQLKRSVDSAERTAALTQAAYVFAGIGGSHRFIDQTGKLRGVVLSASAVNYGKTPGAVSHIEWDFCPEGDELPENAPPYAHKEFVGWTISTGREGELSKVVCCVLPFSKPHLFYGRIAYKDIFHSKWWHSEFMHRVFPDGTAEPVEERDAYARTTKDY